MLNEGTYLAVLSGVMWAISVPILRWTTGTGKSNIDKVHNVTSALLGLTCSLSIGILVLLILQSLFGSVRIVLSSKSIIAGLLMFPGGTGLYYLANHIVPGKAELVAQTVKAKPVIAALGAIVILNERMPPIVALSFVFVAVGVTVLVVSSRGENKRLKGISVGLLGAALWAFADLILAHEINDTQNNEFLVGMLLSGFVGVVLMLVCWQIYRGYRSEPVAFNRSLFGYVAHGMTSFGIAYPCYFAAISKIGLIRTVLINSFWPILGLLFVVLVYGRQSVTNIFSLIVGGGCIICGSIIIVLRGPL